MDKEQITEELHNISVRIGELTNEIAKLENCFGVRVVVSVTYALGTAQIALDVKTSGKDTANDAALGALKNLADNIGRLDNLKEITEAIEKEDNEPFNVDEELKKLLKRPEQN